VVLAAALVGLAMALVAQRGELKAETALPFGPALALAFWGGFLLAARG
jgi:prepilin signal peptidase PulO-like enzyme (type II secretory pathway)